MTLTARGLFYLISWRRCILHEHQWCLKIMRICLCRNRNASLNTTFLYSIYLCCLKRNHSNEMMNMPLEFENGVLPLMRLPTVLDFVLCWCIGLLLMHVYVYANHPRIVEQWVPYDQYNLQYLGARMRSLRVQLSDHASKWLKEQPLYVLVRLHFIIPQNCKLWILQSFRKNFVISITASGFYIKVLLNSLYKSLGRIHWLKWSFFQIK